MRERDRGLKQAEKRQRSGREAAEKRQRSGNSSNVMSEYTINI